MMPGHGVVAGVAAAATTACRVDRVESVGLPCLEAVDPGDLAWGGLFTEGSEGLGAVVMVTSELDLF
jgi:hypothetical protein